MFNKKEYQKQYHKQWLKTPKGIKHKEYQKQWYQENKENQKEYYKEWRKNNFEKLKKYKREWEKSRRQKSPKHRLDGNMANAIGLALKGKKAGRRWEKLAGYSVEDLMKHIEPQFEIWMNWDNYGKWHIDHIRPIASFNYTTAENPEFKECWSLKNLQPMEKIANIKKGCSVVENSFF